MKYTANKNLVLAMMIGLMLFNLILSISSVFNQKTFGTIEPHALVSHIVGKKAKQLIALYPNGKLPQDKLQILLEDLQHEIKSFSKEKNITLLTKNAVLGGELPDYTEALAERIKGGD